MRKCFPYQLAAIDIDDTLAGPDKLIGDANRIAVRQLQASGCRVVLASGRRHGNMLRYSRLLGLTDFIISAQGAVTRHAISDDVIHHAPLDRPLADEVIELGHSLDLGLVIFTPDGAFSAKPTAWTEKLKRDTGGDLVYIDRLPPPAGQIVEKVLWCDEPAKLSAMFDEMTDRYAGRAIVTITDPHLLEYTSPLATKATGLAAVAKHYGINQAHTLAFGDGNNDVPMLDWAGLGIAMSHGSANARRVAKRVSPPGDPETSLARAVEALLGGG